MRRLLRAEAQADVAAMVTAFRWGDPSFTENPLAGGFTFASTAEARRAWPLCRRPVWARAHRLSVPLAAQVFDGLTLDGLVHVHAHWNRVGSYDLTGALKALEHDRAALTAFRGRDPKGARAIGDFLTQLEVDLELVERTARDLGAWAGEGWLRPYPSQLCMGSRYGDGASKESR